MRVFVSYHTPDHDEANRLCAALCARLPELDIYIAPERNALGAYWLPRLGEELRTCDAVLLVLGDRVGPWQELEYYEAMRLSRQSSRPLILPVVIATTAPGLQFLDLHHQLFARGRPVEETAEAVCQTLEGIAVVDDEPPWRRYNPYRGLAALGTEDARFFFGREAITGEILECICRAPQQILALVGNSGVGKSSLAQAGVIASLRSQVWAGDLDRPWPAELADSRSWLAITISPGEAPLKELARGFARTWAKGGEVEREARTWAELLRTGSSIQDLVRSTAEEIGSRTNDPPPRRFLLYVDQGEELYTRSDPAQMERFSALLEEAADSRALVVLTSLRADYYGSLQADESLFGVTRRIDVPPLSAAQLESVIRRPAATLGARFAVDEVIPMIAGAAAREPGSLPLLSYLMTDVWDAMRGDEAGDGVLQLPLEMIDVSRTLAERAERFLAREPYQETVVRHLFAFKLAHVPMDGEPVRRRARRAECTDEEWEIVEQLASAHWRLLTAGGDETDITAEVAHEALLRKWPRLTRWLDEERDFLVWKGQLEQTRRRYEATAEEDKAGALLMGTPLLLAQGRLAERAADLDALDRTYIEASVAAARRRAWRSRIAVGATLAVGLAAALFVVTAQVERLEAETQHDVQRRQVLVSISEQETAQGNATTGLLHALDALGPDGDGGRPHVPMAEVAMYSAYHHHREVLILRAHAGSLRSVAFSPDGTRLVTGGDEGAALWNAATGARERDLQSGGAVHCAAFSPDGRWVVTASADGAVLIRSAASGEIEHVLAGRGPAVRQAAFSPDGLTLLAASDDGLVRLWSVTSGRPIATLLGHGKGETLAAFSPDGEHVVSASADGTARLWEATTGRRLHLLRGHTGPITHAAFSRDGRLVTASVDSTARVWNVDSGALVGVLKGHDGRVRAALFSPDGTRLITSSDDRTARLRSAIDGEVITVLQGHERGVGVIAFSPDSERLVTGTDSGTVHLWDAATGESIAAMRGHGSEIRSIAFSPDGLRVSTASDDGTVRVWNATRETNYVVLEGHVDRVRGAAFAPDGEVILTASSDGTARLWRAAGGEPMAVLEGHGGQVVTANFSPDGQRAVTGSEDRTARVWDVATGEQVAVLRGHGGWVRDAMFSAEGAAVLTASDDGMVRRWDLATSTAVATLEGHQDKVYSAAFSADGRRIVTASADGTVRVWSSETNQTLLVIRGHDGAVRTAAFSPDGTRIVTAADDRTARVWDAQSGELLTILRGHGRGVRAATFSPDGRRVVSASIDRTARIWDASTGDLVAHLIGHRGPIQRARFSPDGLRVLTASSDSRARVWRIFPTTEMLIDHVSGVVARLDPHGAAIRATDGRS